MHSILLILKELAAFQDNHSKFDSYPEMVRLHQKLADHCLVLPLRFYTPGQRTAFEKDVGSNPGTSLIRAAWRIPDKILSIFFRDKSYTGLMRYYRIKYFFALKAVERSFEKNGKPEILAALHSCDESGIFARLVGEKFNIPFVIMERKTSYARHKLTGGKKQLLCETLSCASYVLPVSEGLRQNIFNLCPQANIVARSIPNPSAASLFESTQPNNEVLRFAKGRYVFAGWTNWRPIKRLDLLIEAFRQARKQRTDICLVVAGRIPQQVWESLPSGEWQHHALFLGHVGKPTIKALSAASDCCVIPSDHETFGLPAIEALSAGIPAIVTRCGGPEEIIADKSLGRVIDRGDSQGLTQAMLEVCDVKDTFDPQYIKDYCQKNFGNEKLLKELNCIYNTVLAEHNLNT